MTEHQMLAFAEWQPDDSIVCGGRFAVIDLVQKPWRIWTLLVPNAKRTDPPSLPIEPQHNVNAFLEDETHDWTWRAGRLRYYTRVADRSVWLLIVYRK